MSSERSSLLSPSARAQQTRHRAALLATSVLAIATLAIVVLNVSLNFASVVNVSTGSTEFRRTVFFPADANGHRDLLPLCEEKFITQNLNHFVAGGQGTFEQRYFVCGRQFFNADNGTIFFYNGNEGDVLLYLNNTGLMWENAEEFNAMLVFAEHRYFGKSMPAAENMEFLGSTQALADFAVLIQHLKEELRADVPVIGFGGSYGGMLAAWFRLKYPHLMDGAISGSAPLLHFLNDREHPVDTEAFQRIVTFDMSPAAGSSENCQANVRKSIATLTRLSSTSEGREIIRDELRLCNPDKLQEPGDIRPILDATADLFGNLAMGSYPYPSSYITGGNGNLPAYPMRTACESLAPDFGDHDRAVLAGLRGAIGVFYNVTQDAKCYYDQAVIDLDLRNLGEYIKCWELYMPVSSDGINDVFPVQPYNFTADDERCVRMWGLHLRSTWAETEYGGVKALRQAGNIIFSNGNYDPWSGTGVLTSLSESVVAVVIDGGGHHVDLFFENSIDPPSLREARRTEKQHMHKWVREFYARKSD